ncbi:MAG: nucleotide exchange factor GrpE [Gemmatimonadota bacterium]|nr:MAG: nucleotide exchange factor GrpE [Gemmatimonadota bacterium]
MTKKAKPTSDEMIEAANTEAAGTPAELEEQAGSDLASATTESVADEDDAGSSASAPSDQGGGGTGEAAEGAEPKPDLQEEFDELNDRYLRLAAEFTNYKRRAEGERLETWSRAQAEMVRQFVDALDDLQRVGAWQPDTTTVEALVEGVDLVERKFRQALEAAGVEVLDPVGERFDPNMMAAMMRVPTDSEEEDDIVHDVMQKGYTLKGHLVRPAGVSVKKLG